jgi:glycerophosphoryl diester phosphodiesterase
MEVLHRTCIASFSDRRLWWVRTALRESACTAAGPRELTKASAQAARGQPLDLPGVNVLQIPRLLARRSLLLAAQRVGLPVHVWTVNDGAEMERLLTRGVDGVMSDDTEVLASVFTARGWQPQR